MNITPMKAPVFGAKFTDNKNLREITSSINPTNKTIGYANNFAKIQPDTEVEIYYNKLYKQYNNQFLEVGLKNLKNNQNLDIKLVKYDANQNLLDDLLTDLTNREALGDEFWHADLSPNNKVHNILINKK